MPDLLDWAPNKVYSRGDLAINPSGDLVRAKQSFRSGAAYVASDWVTTGHRTPSNSSAAMGAGAGTTPPAPVVGTSNDTRGLITFGTGATPAAGNVLTINFGRAFDTAPGVVISPANAATAALQPYVASVSTTQAVIGFGVAPAASQSNATYAIQYQVEY